MAVDPIRASDTERERVVERLRDAAAQGRLTVDELDQRVERAYTAVTRGELAVLLEDLPAPRHPALAPRPQPAPARALFPGRRGFTETWHGPADPYEAADDIRRRLLPVFSRFGYSVVGKRGDRLVLRRQTWDQLWLRVFGLEEIVAIELTPCDGYTRLVVRGVGPLELRRALAEL